MADREESPDIDFQSYAKCLIIPDYVKHSDIPKIINYFDYYNIANVKDVYFHKHEEPEYYVNNEDNYGYAIIQIDEWFNNNCSKGFYENIINKNCRMIYEDLGSEEDNLYWDVELYEEDVDNKLKNNIIDDILEDEEDYIISSDDENWSEKNLNINKKSKSYSDLSDNEDNYEGDEYMFSFKSLERIRDTVNVCNKTILDAYELIKELKDIIIKKNRNFIKNNKRSSSENSWVRRLRIRK